MTASSMRAAGYVLGILSAAAIAGTVVLLDPAGFGTLGLGFAGLLFGVCGFALMRGAWLADGRNELVRRLTASGLAGTATITALGEARNWSSESPRYLIRLNVALPGRPVYQVTVKDLISASALPALSERTRLPGPRRSR